MCIRDRCSEEVQHINMDNYLELILPEARKSFTGWMKENLKGKMAVSYTHLDVYKRQRSMSPAMIAFTKYSGKMSIGNTRSYSLDIIM